MFNRQTRPARAESPRRIGLKSEAKYQELEYPDTEMKQYVAFRPQELYRGRTSL